MAERWKPVPGFETHYEVSDLGNARRISAGRNTLKGRLLKPLRTRGYRRFQFCVDRIVNGRKQWQCHRLVWTAFEGPIPPDMQINHKNGIKDDNRLENLEVVTPSQNKIHSIAVLGKHPTHLKPKSRGSSNGRAKITEDDVITITQLYRSGVGQTQIAARFNIASSMVSHIITGRSWTHVVHPIVSHLRPQPTR